jgi:hypothetical protein
MVPPGLAEPLSYNIDAGAARIFAPRMGGLDLGNVESIPSRAGQRVDPRIESGCDGFSHIRSAQDVCGLSGSFDATRDGALHDPSRISTAKAHREISRGKSGVPSGAADSFGHDKSAIISARFGVAAQQRCWISPDR